MVLSVVPLWMRLLMHLLTLGGIPLFAAMAWVEGGLVGVGAACAVVTAAAGWVVVLRLSLTRARTQFPPEGAVAASPLVAVALAVALASVLAAAACWGYVFVDDPAALPNPGFVLWVGIGAVGCLPVAVRVLTGRYRRWRLRITPEALVHEGGRGVRRVPWPAVGSVEVNAQHTQLTIAMAENGGPPLTVSTLLLESDAEALRDHLLAARAARVTG